MESSNTSIETKYKGVGGWLLLFCIGLTILTPLRTAFNLTSGYKQASPYFEMFPGLLIITIIDSVLSIALIGFSIYAGIALWKIRPNAVKIAKKYLLTLLGYSILAAFLPFMVSLPSEANQAMIGVPLDEHEQIYQDITSYFAGQYVMELREEIAKGIFRSIIYVAVWYSYLNKSQRVKATYGAGSTPEKQTLHIPKPPFKNRQEYETWKAAKLKKSEKVSQEPPAKQPEFSLEISCPHCQEKISKDSIKCKYCAEDVRNYQKAETDKIAIALNQGNTAEQPIISSNASAGEKIDSLLDSSQPINDTKADLKNKLGRLDEIFKEGIISKQEYKTKKEKLLEEFLSN